MTPLEQVCKLLLELDANELAEVRARAGILAQAGGAKRSHASAGAASTMPEALEESDVELILGEIAGHLKDQGIEYASVQQLKCVSNFRAFAEKVPATMIYFRKATTNRVKLRALIRVAIRFLYADLHRMNVSASTRTMMNHWHRVPAVINQNFPGYSRRGHLGLLLGETLAYVKREQPKRKAKVHVRDERDIKADAQRGRRSPR